MDVAVTLEVDRLDDTGTARDGAHVLCAGGRAWADRSLELGPPVLIVDATRLQPVRGTPGCRADRDGPAWEASYRVPAVLVRTGRAWLVEATLPVDVALVQGDAPRSAPDPPDLADPVAPQPPNSAAAPATPQPPSSAAAPATPQPPPSTAADPPAATAAPPPSGVPAERSAPTPGTATPRDPVAGGNGASSPRRAAPRQPAPEPAVLAATARMERALHVIDALRLRLDAMESELVALRELSLEADPGA